MKIINATFFIKADKRSEFLSIIQPLIDASRLEKGNLSYDLYESIDKANQFTMIEHWENQKAIDSYNETPLFKKLFLALPELSSDKVIVTVSDN